MENGGAIDALADVAEYDDEGVVIGAVEGALNVVVVVAFGKGAELMMDGNGEEEEGIDAGWFGGAEMFEGFRL